jgi:dephospho-CoA kinase
MNIGLTGGIACGKSTVASLLVERGSYLIDADRIAREVVEPGSTGLDRIVERFGQAVLKEDGSLNRKKLGEIIFNDTIARRDLESILHPQIRALMQERMAAAEREDPNRLVVVDVPLLYESKLQSMFEAVMVVYVPVWVQRERLIRRDGLTAEQADVRIQSQMSIEEKRDLANYVIDNSGTIESTKEQLDQFWRERGMT